LFSWCSRPDAIFIPHYGYTILVSFVDFFRFIFCCALVYLPRFSPPQGPRASAACSVPQTAFLQFPSKTLHFFSPFSLYLSLFLSPWPNPDKCFGLFSHSCHFPGELLFGSVSLVGQPCLFSRQAVLISLSGAPPRTSWLGVFIRLPFAINPFRHVIEKPCWTFSNPRVEIYCNVQDQFGIYLFSLLGCFLDESAFFLGSKDPLRTVFLVRPVSQVPSFFFFVFAVMEVPSERHAGSTALDSPGVFSFAAPPSPLTFSFVYRCRAFVFFL